MVQEFSAKIEAGEAKYRMVPEMRKQRSRSHEALACATPEPYFKEEPDEPLPAKAPLHKLRKSKR